MELSKTGFELANFNAEEKEKPGYKTKGKVKHKANSATSGHKSISKSSSDDVSSMSCSISWIKW